jgi:hypothetical protein
MIVNSSLLTLLLKLARATKSPALKHEVLNVIARLIRYATFLSWEVVGAGAGSAAGSSGSGSGSGGSASVSGGMISVLSELMRDAHVPVRFSSHSPVLLMLESYASAEIETSPTVVWCGVVWVWCEQTRRRAACALGELLFYIATQDYTSSPTALAPEQKSADASADSGSVSASAVAASSPWQVSSAVIKLLCRCLRAGEDDVVRHYILKTIENV